ncbi:MAG: CDP-alcohol phosphatidyltransferase family protein [Desulfatiglandaceae bacterium]
MGEFTFLSDKNRERYLGIIQPVGNLLARLSVHPNILSLAGLILSMVAGVVYSTGAFFWAGWIVVLAGTCDVLDGQIARQTGKRSQFGAFFDSTLDRFGEVFIFLGLAWYFSDRHQSPWVVLLIILAITGSFMVSYTRARAEGLGIDCKVGLMQRPERVTLLIIGSLVAPIPVIGPVLIKLTLLLLAVLSNLTAVQRMFYVKNQILKDKQAL